MIKRKTMEKRKCPECGSTIDRLYGTDDDGNYTWKQECPKCGDVTEKFLLWLLKDRWGRKLADKVPKNAFEFEYPKGVRKLRLKCKVCLTTYSHPANYCIRCNGETGIFETDVLVKEWMNRAPNRKELERRFSFVYPRMILDWLYPNMKHNERLNLLMEILEV